MAVFHGNPVGERMTKIEAEEIFCGFEVEEVKDRSPTDVLYV